jgi:hypothetical protein
LNDSNFTSGNGARTIVFDVGGTIWIGRQTTDTEGYDTNNSINVGTNITIAGQTAPGGITIMGGQLKVNGKTQAGFTLPQANSVIRDVTLAAGYGMRTANSTSGYYDHYTFDNMDINSDGVMIDHVSALYSTDESISANENASHVTIQYTTMAQGQSYPQADAEGGGSFKSHALGNLWGLGSNAVSTFSHNLYANTSGRIPTIQTESDKLVNGVPAYTDFRDNVVYNWYGSAGYGSSGEPGAGQFINNYYKVGAGGDGSSGGTSFAIVPTTGGTSVFSGSSSTKVFASGNVRQNLNNTMTNIGSTSYGSGAALVPATTFAAIPYNGVTDSAAAAYNQVLNYAGANWQSRDSIDARLVNEVMNGTGKIAALDDANNGFNSAGQYVANSPNNPDLEWNKLLALRSTTNGGTGATGAYTRAANFDTDADGMPDIWEAAMGLNPAVADNNGTIENSGYTNLENYLDDLGAWPASAAVVFGNGNGNGRYAEIGNWQTGVFEPSRFDTAQVDSGNVTVDTPGQHANVLSVATGSSNTATFSVTGGWIDVTSNLLVGPGGTALFNQSGGIVRAGNEVVIGGTNHAGTYNLSNGVLATPLLTKGAAGGSFNMTGGTLHANTVAFSLTNKGGVIAPGSDLNLQLIAAASMPDITGNVEAILPFVGSTHVQGDLTLQSGSLQIDLASLGSFDTIAVDDLLTLGGNLSVVLDNGYQPNVGDWWQIGAANSITGSFASITNGFGVQTVGGNLFLVALPEPGMGAVILVGGLAGLRRRKRRASNV